MNELIVGGTLVAVAIAGGLAYRHDKNKSDAAKQQELDKQLRDNPPSVLLPLREEYATHSDMLGRSIANHRRAAGESEATRDRLSRQVWRGQDPKLGFMVIVSVLSLLWLGLFVLQRSTDITVMQALGTVAPQLFGNVIAVVFVILGIFLGGIAGGHHLLPDWLEPKRVLTRVMIITGLLIVAVLGIEQIAELAQYRSIDKFSAQVDTDNATVAQLKTQTPSAATQVQITAAEGTLVRDEQRLDNARAMDKTLTMATLPAELLLSAFPIIGIELLVVAGHGRAGKRHRKLEQQASDEKAALPQQFRQQAATMLAQANPTMSIAGINSLLAQLNGPQGASGPTNTPPHSTERRPDLRLLPPNLDSPPATAPEAPVDAPRRDQARPGGLGDVRPPAHDMPTPRVPGRDREGPAPVRPTGPDSPPDDTPPTWSLA